MALVPSRGQGWRKNAVALWPIDQVTEGERTTREEGLWSNHGAPQHVDSQICTVSLCHGYPQERKHFKRAGVMSNATEKSK